MTSDNKGTVLSPSEGFKMPQRRSPKSPIDKEVRCGAGACKPSCLQCCANLACFSGTYGLSGFLTSVLSVYIASQITTLERVFNFSSSFSGIILSCNDIGYLATTLVMSYLARRVHIPRSLAAATMFFGLSGLICAVPNLLTDLRLTNAGNATAYGQQQSDGVMLCSLYKSPTASLGEISAVLSTALPPWNTSLEEDLCQTQGEIPGVGISPYMRQIAISILALGMGLQGFAKSPRQSFVSTYIDDNVEDKDKTTLYLGVVTGISIFGPAVAFSIGSLFSQIYVTLEETDMSTRDPRWIGAWWLGFLVFGLLGLIVGIPLLFFPRRLIPRQRERTAHYNVKGFFRSLLELVTNPIFMLTVLGNCVGLLTVSGMMSFGSKYMESTFFIPAWRSNLIMGAMTVLAASIGSMSSGILISKLRLSPQRCILIMIATHLLGLILGIILMFLGCDQPTLHRNISPAGDDISRYTTAGFHNGSLCDVGCSCDDVGYFPICGDDGLTYFSPCEAGCTAIFGRNYNCSCLSNGFGLATPGVCPQDCAAFIPYIILCAIGAFIATLAIMPSWVVYVRSVPESNKPMALGFSAFLITLLGWLPGPVLAGKIVDSTCVIWSSSCAGHGSCLLYDTANLRFRYYLVSTGGKLVTLLCSAIVFFCAKYKKQPFFVQTREKNGTVAEGEELMGTHNNNEKTP